MKKITFLVCLIGLLVSCKKYSESVAGRYLGEMSRNDTLIGNNTILDIIEVDKKRVSIECLYFDSYQIDIERRRYFGSVTYFDNGDTSTELEIGETSSGLFLALVYNDSINRYTFIGERN
tara:strand:- start:25 stop:384 length:360 start_codon:yes stop_codon:yes gene_type:complete